MQLENNLSFFVKIYFTSIIIEISKRDRVKIFKRSEQRQKNRSISMIQEKSGQYQDF
jgi:hypothetical protein